MNTLVALVIVIPVALFLLAMISPDRPVPGKCLNRKRKRTWMRGTFCAKGKVKNKLKGFYKKRRGQ